MELHQAEIQTMKSKLLPTMEEALIVPIGDVQYGTEACDVDRFRRHIEHFAKIPNAYFIGMGDYLDLASPSNRGRLEALIAQGELYDTVQDALENASLQVLEEIEKILEPTKGRWLGLLEGHHYYSFSSGATSDTKLCEFLQAPFLGTCAMVRVAFAGKEGDHRPAPAFTIWAHHGRGAGQLQGSPLNKLEQIVKAFDADVYLIGHHHKKPAAKMQRIYPQWGRIGSNAHTLKHKNIIIAGTGGFLRGYMKGGQRRGRAAGGYVEAGMMTPVALGGVVIYARPRYANGHEQVANVDLDISI